MKIYLRELKITDADSIFAITSDPAGGKFMRYGAHTDISQAKELIEKYTTAPNMAFAVIERENEELAGYIGLACGEDAEFSMTMMIAPNYRDMGLGTQVIAEIKSIADDKRSGINVLTGHVVGDNAASRRMLEKNGFEVCEKLVFDDLPQGLYVYRYQAENKEI